MKNKVLFFLTDGFPFGKGESFIENEIYYLANNFEKVFIVSKNPYDKQTRQVPKNCEIFRLKKNYAELLKIFINKFYLYNFIKEFSFLNIKREISFLFYARLFEKKILEIIEKYNLKNKEIIIYSYWFYNGAYAASILKKKKIVNKIISRAHGYDIFLERGPQFFKKQILKELDVLIPACYNSELYLKNLYTEFSDKIKYSHLGIHQKFNINLKNNKERNIIISCSNIIELKRIDLLIESLQHLNNKKICWIHIGSGKEEEKIKNLAKEKLKNITFKFLGQLTNKNVLNFYKENIENILCMVHLSKTEGGTPVSMMEVQSFGIPIIATNVGGIKEIVNEKTGILLSSNPKIDEIVNAIEKMSNLSNEKYEQYQINSYQNWKINFNAENNYLEFIKKYL